MDVVNAFATREITSYDYSTNRFKRSKIDTVNIQQYYNMRADVNGDQMHDKQFMLDKIGVDIVKNGSYWNNDFDLYSTITRCLMKNNALMIETDGEIQCIPGCQVMVKIDREYDPSEFEDPDTMEEQLKRYMSYEGLWIAARVHTYV